MIWIGGTSGTETSWEEPNNWDTSAVPTSADDVYFTSASGYDCVASAPAACNSITTAGFTHNISFNGTTLTCMQGAAFDHTGTLNLGNGLTANGNSATVHIGSGVGTVTATSCVLTMNGTTGMVLDDDKGITLDSLYIKANAVVTSSGSGSSVFSSTTSPLTLENNSTLTLSATTGFYLTASANMWSIGSGVTFNITGETIVSFRIDAANITVGLPAVTIGDAGIIHIRNDGAADYGTFNLSGNLNITGAVHIYRTGVTNTITFNQNNYAINVAGLNYGCNNATGIFIGNFDGSIICTTVNATTYNTGTITINDTATWSIGGNFTALSTATYNVTAGTKTITNTSTLTNNSKVWAYDLTINASGKTVQTADALSVGNNFVLTDGNWTHTGYTLTCGGGASFDGTGTLNCGNGITCNGASSTLHFGSTLGTVTATSCVLTMNGTTTMVLDDDKGVSFKILTLGANAVVTNSGSTTTGFSSSTSPLIFTNNGTLTVNRNMRFDLTGSDSFISILAGTPTINGTETITLRCDGSIATTIPAISLSGSVSLTVTTGGIFTASTTLAGNLLLLGTFIVRVGNAGAALTFGTANYSITSNNFQMGGSTAGTFISNFGSSIIDINDSFNTTTYNTATTTLNLGTSTWTIGGDCDIGSNTTINNTDTCIGWTFDGTTALSLTTAGETLPALTFSKTGGGTTLSDNLTCQSLTISSTNNQNFNANGKDIVVATGVSLGSTGGTTTIDAALTFSDDGDITITGSATIAMISATVTVNNMTLYCTQSAYALNINSFIVNASKTVYIKGYSSWENSTIVTQALTLGASTNILAHEDGTGLESLLIELYATGDLVIPSTANIQLATMYVDIMVTPLDLPYIKTNCTITWIESYVEDSVVNLTDTIEGNEESGEIYFSAWPYNMVVNCGSQIVKTFQLSLSNWGTSLTVNFGSGEHRLGVLKVWPEDDGLGLGHDLYVNYESCHIVNMQETVFISLDDPVYDGYGDNYYPDYGTSVFYQREDENFHYHGMGFDGPHIVFAQYTGPNYVNFYKAQNKDCNIKRIEANGSKLIFGDGIDFNIQEYTNGDIDGIEGHLTILESETSGVHAIVTFPSEITVSYVNPTYIDSSNGGAVNCNDGTSLDGRNNINWIFAISVLVSASSLSAVFNYYIPDITEGSGILVSTDMTSAAFNYYIPDIIEGIGVLVSTGKTSASFDVYTPNVSGSSYPISATGIRIDFIVSEHDNIKVRMFADYSNFLDNTSNWDNMPNEWIVKCDSDYDSERRLFDNLITEAYNFHGVCMTYYSVSYDTAYDPIWGEDNNRRFSRKFDIMAYYNLPREEKLWTKFGIDNMDQFSIFVSKLHFSEASTFGMSAVAGDTGQDTYPAYIPKVGDILTANYNHYIYEIVEVKEEIGMYLLSKQHIWELIVKPFKDEHIALSATTSAAMDYIKDYTNQSADTLDISNYVNTVVTAVNYDPPSDEKSSQDPFAGW